MDLWQTIAAEIAAASGLPFREQGREAVGGGCINAGVRLRGGDRDYFVKLNDAARVEMFAAEAEGLAEMAATGTVRVPRPVCWGRAGGRAYLVLEYLPLQGGGTATLAALGRALAALHRCTAPRYGWRRDNTIGSTPQRNDWCDDWVTFWRERRLGPQLELAAARGFGGALQRRGARLLERLDALLESHRPAASLLHGDLWGGNWAAAADGTPVLFDPAVYYGDREADLAMTELFGGFGPAFYAAYEESHPLPPGYSRRKALYNLYHVLNHVNLFGGGYVDQAERLLDRLLD